MDKIGVSKDQLLWGVLFLVILWQLAISFWFFKVNSFFSRLTKGLKRDNDFKAVLDNLLKNIDLTNKEFEQIKANLEKYQIDSVKYLQKYALLRFNPFADTGGDQSFILALLNGNNDGVVISSLHARDQSRIYAKPIKNGQSIKYELSKEEMEVLSQAMANSV